MRLARFTLALLGLSLLPVQALEIPLGPVPSPVPILTEHIPTQLVSPNAVFASLLVYRAVPDGREPVTATFRYTDVSAIAGTHYTPVTSVTFAAGQTVATLRIPIVNHRDPEAPARTFRVTTEQGGVFSQLILTYLGAWQGKSIDVTITGKEDMTPPPPPQVLRPADHVIVSKAQVPLTFSGIATDDKGVKEVWLSENGVDFVIPAKLGSPGAKRTTFTVTSSAAQPVNVVHIRTLDMAGFSSEPVSRTYRVRIPSPLTVKYDPSMGTVSAGFAGTTQRNVAMRYSVTAIPRKKPAGAVIFSHWTVENATLEQIGVTEDDLYRATLSFNHAPNLVLTAHFAANSFREYAGTYVAQMLDRHPDRFRRDNDSIGFFSATILPTGAFTAQIQFGGQVHRASGSFGTDLQARYASNHRTMLLLPRAGKPPLILHGSLARNPHPICHFTIMEEGVEYFALGVGHRAVYDGATRVAPSAYLGQRNAPGAYTSIFEPFDDPRHSVTNLPQEAPVRVPGLANLTLYKNGKLLVAGMLPDHTPVTASTVMTEEGVCPFFVPLYSGKGHFTAGLYASVVEGKPKFTSEENWWVRPPLDTHYYPKGWPQGLAVDVAVQRFSAVPGQSIFSTNSVRSPEPVGTFDSGNMYLHMSYPDTDLLFVRGLNVNAADKVTKIPVDDPSCTLSIDRNTGRISGQFNMRDGTRPSFQGMICESSGGTSAMGYFLSVAPKVKDNTGRAGKVILAMNARTVSGLPRDPISGFDLGGIDVFPAHINGLNAKITDTQPPQICVSFGSYLENSAVRFHEMKQERTAEGYKITVTHSRPLSGAALMVITGYVQMLNLSLEGFPSGPCKIVVNNLETTVMVP